jgi:hypothetical protein
MEMGNEIKLLLLRKKLICPITSTPTTANGSNALTIPITKIIARAENPTFLTIDFDSSVMYCHLGRRGMS